MVGSGRFPTTFDHPVVSTASSRQILELATELCRNPRLFLSLGYAAVACEAIGVHAAGGIREPEVLAGYDGSGLRLVPPVGSPGSASLVWGQDGEKWSFFDHFRPS